MFLMKRSRVARQVFFKLRPVAKYAKPICGASLVASMASECYASRPVPSSKMYIDSLPMITEPVPSEEESLPLALARSLIMVPTYLFARVYLSLTASKITIIDAHKLNDAVEHRPKGT